jgi:hypothetical protein
MCCGSATLSYIPQSPTNIPRRDGETVGFALHQLLETAQYADIPRYAG